MKIGIIGMGYVGLVTSAVLANHGNHVVGVDIDTEKITKLKNNSIPIFEPQLEKYINENNKRLEFSTDYRSLIDREAVFICTPTPTKNGRIDTSYVEKSCRNLKNVNPNCTVIIKSTVVPGTAKRIINETKMDVITNPEFTREGSAIFDTENPDRIVIGGANTSLVEKIWSFTESPIITTTNENAELIKYASNSFLAMKISFINEIANLCERIPGADVDVIAKGMGYDKRIAPLFLKAGIGYGGSCFPKDTEALYGFAQDNGVHMTLIEAVMEINQTRVAHAINLIETHNNNFKGKKIGVLGIAFKDNTDDIRESKAIEVVNTLVQKGYEVSVFDPSVKKINLNVKICNSIDECVKESDVIVIAGEWNEFRSLETMDISKPVFDLKRILDKNSINNYRGIGLWRE